MSVRKYVVPYKITNVGQVEVIAHDEDEARFYAAQFLIMGSSDDFEAELVDTAIEVSSPVDITDQEEPDHA